MCIRLGLIAAAIVCIAAAPGPDVKPTVDSVHSAAAQCTMKCPALMTVSRALDIALDALATSVGDAQPLPLDRDRVAERKFAKLLSHSGEFVAICDTSRVLAARYPGADGSGETFVAVSLVELAARIDAHGGACLPSVLAAFPRLPKADTAIRNARMLCANAWHLDAQCPRISRPP